MTALFAWHLRERAFERLTPPWLDVQVKGAAERLSLGMNVELTVRKFGVPLKCTFKVTELEADKKFVDEQIKGPFAHWRHQHLFQSRGENGSLMNDQIAIGLPVGFLSELFAGPFMDLNLYSMFRYRHEVLKHDLAAYIKNSAFRRRKILICGSLDGLEEPLHNYLSTQGHQVIVITPGFGEKQFQSSTKTIERARREKYDALVYRANSAEPVGASSDAFVMQIFEQLKDSLTVAIEISHLASPSEKRSQARIVRVCMESILSPAFGVLKDKPTWKVEKEPWIAVDDAVAVIEHCILHDEIQGNVIASAQKTGHAGTKATEKALSECGYTMRYANLESALKHELGI